MEQGRIEGMAQSLTTLMVAFNTKLENQYGELIKHINNTALNRYRQCLKQNEQHQSVQAHCLEKTQKCYMHIQWEKPNIQFLRCLKHRHEQIHLPREQFSEQAEKCTRQLENNILKQFQNEINRIGNLSHQ